eukprot:GHVN01056826.1.p1 GENE.GHVN01056826.1~~GHVN01056826.1.p1  ORF type:complete len:696 (+),score=92.16 GHVN01056826.1:1781-3868(+)
MEGETRSRASRRECESERMAPLKRSPSSESVKRKSSDSLSDKPTNEPANWWEDRWNIAILFVLYTLQGIPMGLSASVPLLMQGRVSYSEQGKFSMVSLPFSLKLFWAPLVDSLHFESIGRRKTWLIPSQFICALLMIYFGSSNKIGYWIAENGVSDVVHVNKLTVFFLVNFFLMATQDIAVDGWALTMLKPHNKVYASTTNSVGQTLGFVMAQLGFLSLSDAETCFRFFGYLNKENPMVGAVTLAGFVRFWGYVMLAMTVIVAVFKKEVTDFGIESKEPSQVLKGVSDFKTDKTEAKSHSESGTVVKEAALSLWDNHDGTGTSQDTGEGDSWVKPRLKVSSSNERRMKGFEERLSEMTRLNKRITPKPSLRKTVSKDRGVGLVRNGSEVSGMNDCEAGPPQHEPQSVIQSYRLVWKMTKLPAIQLLIIVLLTSRAAFGTTEGATSLKLMERGVTKQQLALLAPLLVPLSLVSPFIVSWLISGPDPLTVFCWGVQLKLVIAVLCTGVVAIAPRLTHISPMGVSPVDTGIMGDGADPVHSSGASISLILYCMLLGVTGVNSIGNDLMFVSQIGFFARIADPLIGGTYMTFLTTLGNIGAKWPQVLSLWLLDRTTTKECMQTATSLDPTPQLVCNTLFDGYYLQAYLSVALGMGWLLALRGTLTDLGRRDVDEWRLTYSPRAKKRCDVEMREKIGEAD